MSEKTTSRTITGGRRLEILRGDITAENVDAIVNAANELLMHGGGVAAAIARRGGPSIQEESDRWVREHGPVTHENPAYTGGGNLPARYVIHAVGPVWGSGDEDRKLAAAVRGGLTRADELKLTSIALPAISTGIFGFPVERAARIFMTTIDAYFKDRPNSSLETIRLILFDSPTHDAFLAAEHDYFAQ